MQTWAAYEMQQVLHCCSSGCSICSADAAEVNSCLRGAESGVQGVLCSAASLLSLWQSICAHGKVNLLSKISFRALPSKRGLGISGELVMLPSDAVAGNGLLWFCRLQGACCRCHLQGSVQALHLDEIGLRAFVKSKEENLMNLDIDYMRGVDTTIPELAGKTASSSACDYFPFLSFAFQLL